MRNQHVGIVLCCGAEQPVQVVRRLVGRVRLGDRRRLVRSLEPNARAVVGADAGEARHRRIDRRVARVQIALAPGHRVVVRIVRRIGRVEDFAPVLGAVALSGDQDHRRRSGAAALEKHLAAAADVDRAGEIPWRRVCSSWCCGKKRGEEQRRWSGHARLLLLCGLQAIGVPPT